MDWAIRKDTYFEAAMRETGVDVYPGTVEFLHLAKRAGLKTGRRVLQPSLHRNPGSRRLDASV